MTTRTHFFSTSTLKKSLFCIVCVFFVSLVVITNSTHAFDLSRDVFEVSSGQFTLSGSTNCLNNITNNTVIRNGCTDTADGLSSIGVILPGGIAEQYLTGDFMQFWFYVGINNTNDASDSFIRNINISNQYLDTVDVSMEQVNNSIGIIKITARTTQTTGVSSFNITASGGGSLVVLYPSEFISAGKIVHWRIVPGADYSSDIQSVVSAINSQTDYSQSLNTINNNISSVNNNLRNIQDAQEQANDDANDRYDDEKQTTYDEAQAGGDNMTDMADAIQDSWVDMPNPFAGIFNYFIDSCSVSIFNIAQWINWQGDGNGGFTVNSWWCQNNKLQSIRGSLTVVLSFVGVLLTFSFIFKWLRTNQGEA